MRRWKHAGLCSTHIEVLYAASAHRRVDFGNRRFASRDGVSTRKEAIIIQCLFNVLPAPLQRKVQCAHALATGTVVPAPRKKGGIPYIPNKTPIHHLFVGRKSSNSALLAKTVS